MPPTTTRDRLGVGTPLVALELVDHNYAGIPARGPAENAVDSQPVDSHYRR